MIALEGLTVLDGAVEGEMAVEYGNPSPGLPGPAAASFALRRSTDCPLFASTVTCFSMA